MHWALLWSENWVALLVLGVVLGGAVYCQLEDLKHPNTARRLLGDRISTILLAGKRRRSEEDALLFAAGQRVQRDWRAWLTLFVPSFVAGASAMLCAQWWTDQRTAHGWTILAAALLCYGLGGAASGPVRCAFLETELTRSGD